MSRSFMEQGYDLPQAELRANKVVLLATQIEVLDSSLAKMVTSIMKRTNCMRKAVNSTARLLRILIYRLGKEDKNVVAKPLTTDEITRAKKLLYSLSMGPTCSAIEKGNLTSLRT